MSMYRCGAGWPAQVISIECMCLANLLIQKLQLKFKSVTIALFMHELAENKSDLWFVRNKFAKRRHSARKAFVKA